MMFYTCFRFSMTKNLLAVRIYIGYIYTYLKAIRVWPEDSRFFTSRTRRRFALMFYLKALVGVA